MRQSFFLLAPIVTIVTIVPIIARLFIVVNDTDRGCKTASQFVAFGLLHR